MTKYLEISLGPAVYRCDKCGAVKIIKVINADVPAECDKCSGLLKKDKNDAKKGQKS